MSFVRTYAKSLLAVAATVVTGLVAALSDDRITSGEWLNVAILAVTACAVFAAPNVPGARYTKATLAVLGGVLTFLASAIIGGITTAEWGQVAVVALAALGVYAVPNTPLNTLDVAQPLTAAIPTIHTATPDHDRYNGLR